jgi:GNAT superfamily N-acetyltransferase
LARLGCGWHFASVSAVRPANGYRVVEAAPEHLVALPAIELDASTLFPESHVPEPLRTVVTPNSAFAAAQREQRLFVALDEVGEPVGFALAGVMDADAYLAELDVKPEHSRRGLGRRLIAAVVGWAEQLGFARLTLATFRDLAWNAPYYERFGFRELDSGEVGPALGGVLRREARAGLDPQRRLTMGLSLKPSAERRVLYVTRAGVGSAALNRLFAAAWPQHVERDFDALLAHSLLYVTAHRGSELAGFVNVAWDGGLHGFILDPTVRPDLQRQGIGGALMAHAVAGARERDLEWLHVDFEPRLASFYRRAGFTSSEAGVLKL